MINIKINTVKRVNDYYLLHSTKIELAALLPHTLDENNITIITANTSSKTALIAHHTLDLMIEPNLVVADTRVTLFFLTKGAPFTTRDRL
jgi:hypothetical protein